MPRCQAAPWSVSGGPAGSALSGGARPALPGVRGPDRGRRRRGCGPVDLALAGAPWGRSGVGAWRSRLGRRQVM
eukprot:9920361-Alexandrium_andersonii.AAC.1